MKVCFILAVAQLLVWVVWAGVSNHPSSWKIRLVAIEECLIIFFQMYDLPPFWGCLDARAISHAIAIPISYICGVSFMMTVDTGHQHSLKRQSRTATLPNSFVN
ncbi:hypothetical protein HanRHA438_Chr04g0174621 [Helianthus annuus]|nr:hypothetical protein HanRHA438_Chr04g0174621 [Helianthus annuus]